MCGAVCSDCHRQPAQPCLLLTRCALTVQWCAVPCCDCCCRYTSGTTGDPKGVLLKHSAVIATVTSLQAFLESGKFHLGPGDSTLSYLPLAHIFDRCVCVCGCLWVRGSECSGVVSGALEAMWGVALRRSDVLCKRPSPGRTRCPLVVLVWVVLCLRLLLAEPGAFDSEPTPSNTQGGEGVIVGLGC